jgi:hypothetical protein
VAHVFQAAFLLSVEYVVACEYLAAWRQKAHNHRESNGDPDQGRRSRARQPFGAGMWRRMAEAWE